MQATHHRLAALALAGFSVLVAADDDVDGSFEDGSDQGQELVVRGGPSAKI